MMSLEMFKYNNQNYWATHGGTSTDVGLSNLFASSSFFSRIFANEKSMLPLS
jgi:hypothetical protein